MVEKYNKIYLLVHPFYDLIIMKGYHNQILGNLKENSVIQRIKIGDKSTINVLKKTTGVYGAQINKISKEEDAMLIIFEPQLREYDAYSMLMDFERYSKLKTEFNKTIELQKEVLSKFNGFIKNRLNNRVIFSNYSPNEGENPDFIPTPKFMNKSFLSKLNKDVKILAFGEYRGLCVKTWGKAIKNRLQRFGINSRLSYLKNKSLPERPTDFSKFRKAILSNHKRRVVQQKEKKAIFKFNQSIKKSVAHI